MLFIECGSAQVDLVIILDSSTSVSEPNYKKMLNFTAELVLGADLESGNIRVGVVTYSTDVTVRFQLNQFGTRQQVVDAILNIPYTYGSTNTAGAIDVMDREMFTVINGDRPDVPNIGIIITDGVSNVNSRSTVPNAVAARARGIHIYAIGIALTDTRELDAMASVPSSDNSFNVNSFDELNILKQKVFSALCGG